MSDEYVIAVTVLLSFMGVALVWVCVGIRGCIRRLRAYRYELSTKAKKLRIYSMLGRLGIGLPRYLRKAPAVDVEKLLLKCQGCSAIHACDAYLQGQQNTHPSTFCPIFKDFERYIPQRRSGWGYLRTTMESHP